MADLLGVHLGNVAVEKLTLLAENRAFFAFE